MSTIFEKIANKEISSYVIYETDNIISFLDISQISIGHTLVIPKKCYKDITELPEEVASELFMVATKIAKSIFLSLKPTGLNILNNNKLSAGQTVFHFHLHLIPRYENDNISFSFPTNKLSETEFIKIQKEIQKNIE
ncbi:MAG: HIT domain-containing protein [Acholeplasmatales bacterium]|jgi:histidine triad (HIT) family protein|nr:HIT domain-containing protein [Acholeplasmatales bacterium]